MAIDTHSNFGTYGKHKLARLAWKFCNHGFFSAATRKKLRKLIAMRFSAPFDVTVDGLNWRLYPQENYCDRVMFSRDHLPEQKERRALDNIIKPGICFVDIGGNIGTYSLYVSKKSAHKARILVLEPQPETYQKLRFNLAINSIDNVTLLPVACGPKTTTMTICSGNSNIGNTSLLKQGITNPQKEFAVSVRPLSDILEEQGIQKIDLLKIDVEGFEDQALVPFFQSADRSLWPAQLLIETAQQNSWQTNVTELMEKNGYCAIFKTADNTLYRLDNVAR